MPTIGVGQVATPKIADRNSHKAALTLALAQPGDTLLYLLLPLYHEAFGVSLAEAGLLLAANRLVRIAGYGWVARFYARRGPRAACRLAAIGSVLSTLGYALLSDVWGLLLARLLWGLSFAAMNISTQALATVEPVGAARRSGHMRAVIAAGPVGGLLGGAVVSQIAGPRTAFLVLAVAALIAIPFAGRLPDEGEGATRLPRPRFGLPSRLDTWSFVQGMTLDEDTMRLTLIAVIAALQLLAAGAPAFACPNGYAPCGSRSCCPK
jgi:MFS family permease